MHHRHDMISGNALTGPDAGRRVIFPEAALAHEYDIDVTFAVRIIAISTDRSTLAR
jgi:hypothetical protein